MPNPVARAKRKHPNLELVEVGVFALLLIVVCAQTYYLMTYVRDQRAITDRLQCQVQLNDVFREALTLRTAAQARERQAQREFLTSRAFGPEQLRNYLAALDEADADRANTPLPTSRC